MITSADELKSGREPTDLRSIGLELDRDYGFSLSGRWVPAPQYVLRRDRILRFFKRALKGNVLEAGCGAGALLPDLSGLGFECTAVETSPQARELANRFAAAAGAKLFDRLQPDWENQFDYLLSCEVLEHVEFDQRVLAEWVRCLKPGGVALLSVPAHMSAWSRSDEWAGHFRRYEKRDVLRLLGEAGLEPIELQWYGFPLSNFTFFLRNWILRQRNALMPTAESRTNQSGVERTVEVRLYGLQQSYPGRLIMRAACQIQRLFLRREWGHCVLIMARKGN